MERNEEETETYKLMLENLIADEEQSAIRSNERTPWMADRNEVAPIDSHGHGLALYEVNNYQCIIIIIVRHL